MRGAIAFGILLVLGAGGASAANCANPTTQSEMNICANQSYERADGELNVKYQEIVRRMQGGSGVALFRAAQRAWIPFRDAECAFFASTYEGGSMQPMAMSVCLEDVTRKRIADFDAYLTCGEGACPVPAQ